MVKHQQNQNFIYSSLTLGTLNKMKLMLSVVFNYNIGGKIRRLSMNVVFKFIWPKRVEFLNPWKDCLSMNNVSVFT